MTLTPEYQPSDLMWMPLPENVEAEIKLAEKLFSDGLSQENIVQFVDDINELFHEHGHIGRPARLLSPLAIINRYKINQGLLVIDPIFDPEEYGLPETIEGIFVGVEPFFNDGGEAKLMYKVDMGFRNEADGNLTALAPTHHARIKIGMDGSVDPRAVEVEEASKLLTGVDDRTFKLNLKHLVSLATGPYIENAQGIVEAGETATALLAHPAVVRDIERKRAVTRLTSVVINDKLTYQIAGKEIIKQRTDDNVLVKVKDAQFVGTVHTAARDNNFELDQQGYVLAFDTINTQPVYLALDSTNVEYLMPLRYFSQFDIVDQPRPVSVRQFQYGGYACQEWQQAFRAHYLEVLRNIQPS